MKNNFTLQMLGVNKQLYVLLSWVIFIGWAMWQHAQQSLQPPLYDASTYYLKAYNFWSKVHQHKLFNPLNVEPSFRPPGTILMSYPFGFDSDYRGFYFRSVFLPIALLVLAVVVGGYRRELDSNCKWHLVLFAAFLSSLPCFYYFELISDLPAPSYWGLVDNFLAGVAALAAAATIRSFRNHSLVWLCLAAVFSCFCLLVKPAGAFVMMLTGLTWFGLAAFQLKLVWQSPDERKSMTRWLLQGMAIFAVPFMVVLASSFTSQYLSPQNLAFGKTAVGILQSEWSLTLPVLLNVIHTGVGYSFIAWLLMMIILVVNHLWKKPTEILFWPKSYLAGLALASSITLLFGIWFWIFSSGVQIRYSIPFVLMAAILALPAILSAVQTMSNWKLAIVSVVMAVPVINVGLLLSQQNPALEWQKWTGVNLTSAGYDPVVSQALNFAREIKQGGRNVTMFSMSLNIADADFQAVGQYAKFSMLPMPIISILRPVDWQRASAFRKEEMLIADYWLFEPVHDPNIVSDKLTNLAIEDLDQETVLFRAWATQLTPKEGVSVVSDTPTARVLRITDKALLESAFDQLVKKHQWRNTFINANPKRRFSEKELAEALVLNPPSLENVNFGNIFHLRALSVSRAGDEVTVRFWWKPLLTLSEQDWVFFIHLIDDAGNIVLNNAAMIYFKHPLSSLDGSYLFDQVTFKNPAGNGTQRLAVGFYRPNQKMPIADKGTRDWDNRRIIVPLL